MMGTKDGRLVRRSGLRGFRGTILAVLALGAIICAAPVLAQSPSARDAAPAPTPSAGGAPVSPPEVAPAMGAGPATPVEPTMEEPKSSPRLYGCAAAVRLAARFIALGNVSQRRAYRQGGHGRSCLRVARDLDRLAREND